ncbi:RimK family protein [Cobetia sp. AM6]|uniref:RimK family protein n=1 Tax=Cobetia sp. AM6 TaxID=2661553 RepID=UPI0032200F73
MMRAFGTASVPALRGFAMSRLRIVVDRVSDWRAFYPSDDVISAHDFLSELSSDTPAQRADDAPQPATHVINLCGGLDYLGIGYYVSLLAQARGQKALPSVETLNQLSRKSLIDMELGGIRVLLEELTRKGALPAPQGVTHGAGKPPRLDLLLTFGESADPALARLARKLFERLPCPLLEVRLEGRGDHWVLKRVRPQSLNHLAAADEDRFAQALNRHSRKVWRTPKARRHYRFDLAMLVDPDEALPPSNRTALKHFIREGRRLGIDVSLITRRDEGRLAEFDGLFIRETTSLDHHTYRMAKRAEHEGLVVIDASQSILRCTNKVFLHELLKARGLSAPQGRLIHRGELRQLAERGQHMRYPLVMKVPDGAFSRGIVKIDGPETLVREAERLFHDSALLLLQEWLPTEFDWRIGVLDGKLLFASRYYMARGHWQIYDHSGARTRSGGFATVDPSEVPAAVIKAALKATRLIGDGLYGVDLKQLEDRVVVIEVNDNPNLDAGVEDVVLGRELYRRVMQVFLARMQARRQPVLG